MVSDTRVCMSGPCGANHGLDGISPIANFLDVGEGLTLRAPRIEDSSDLFLQVDRNRDHLRKWLPWLDNTQTVADEAGFIQMSIDERAKGSGALWLIFSDSELVGTIGLNWVDSQNQGCGIGYWLASEFNGHGIITRCCRRLINHVFEDVGMRRCVLEAAVDNTASRAVAERLGMRLEGITEDREWLYDHWVDAALYAITSPEWENQKSKEK